MDKVKKKTVVFKIEGFLEVDEKVTNEDVEEWLRFHYDIDGTMYEDNPILEDEFDVEDSITFDSIDIL